VRAITKRIASCLQISFHVNEELRGMSLARVFVDVRFNAARLRNGSFALLALAILLVGLRLALPGLIHAHLNHLLAKNPKYEGTVGNVDVALWRGGYKIHDVELHKRGGRVPVPFLKTPLIDVSVLWNELVRGKFVGEMVLDQPQLNFVAGPTEADRQTGVAGEGQWRRLVNGLFPAKFNRIEVRKGSIHFRNFSAQPKVDVSLVDVDLVAGNLENTRPIASKRAGMVEMRGRFENSGYLIVHSTVEPDAVEPSFDCDLIVRGADLRAWNDFLRAYAGVDVEHGKLSLYAELLAENGEFSGYVKPFFKDVEVLDWEKVIEQNPFSTAWEAVVEAVLQVFRNRSEDDIASRIPITGSTKNPRGEFWPALGSAAYNAFIEGLTPKLEHSVGPH
jgi:Domain of Unknown Function (DUF748)